MYNKVYKFVLQLHPTLPHSQCNFLSIFVNLIIFFLQVDDNDSTKCRCTCVCSQFLLLQAMESMYVCILCLEERVCGKSFIFFSKVCTCYKQYACVEIFQLLLWTCYDERFSFLATSLGKNLFYQCFDQILQSSSGPRKRTFHYFKYACS